MSYKRPPTALIILDGFGYSPRKEGNAIQQASLPTITSWYDHYPHTLLEASGESVGLLPGMMGNSEVGHLTIGAGTVIKQSITVLMEMANNNEFINNPVLINVFRRMHQQNLPVHLVGLLSDAGVHSHEKILYALIASAAYHGIQTIILHLFLDGRDTPPCSAGIYLEKIRTLYKYHKKQ